MGLARYLKRSSWKMRRLPDFLVIGVRKGGTTSMFHYLDQHSKIKGASRKEIHFFSLHHREKDWYRQFFPFQGTAGLCFEATPAYLFHPMAAKRIANDLPDVKMILLLRDPIDRAFSNYKMNVELGWDDAETFEDAATRELAFNLPDEYSDRDGSEIYSKAYHNHAYLHQGLYGLHLQRWFKLFPRQQFLILDSSDFFSNPTISLEKCYQFLGVPNETPQDLRIKNKGAYSTPIQAETINKLKDFYRADVQ
ncbi:MAG: sulfotransferase domain-containing protein, partial [Bacteroidota bacterium]